MIRSWLLLGIATHLAATSWLPPAAASSLEGAFEQCRALPEGPERAACYEMVAKQPSALSGASPQTIGSWRMVRTPHPQSGKVAISIMRTAELVGSDADFAGLMIRCGEPRVEVLPVILRPLPLQAKPKVVIGSPPDLVTLEASVASPGSAILLPPQATNLAEGPWQRLTTLAVEIIHESRSIRGSVRLDDLGPALGVLRAACEAR